MKKKVTKGSRFKKLPPVIVELAKFWHDQMMKIKYDNDLIQIIKTKKTEVEINKDECKKNLHENVKKNHLKKGPRLTVLTKIRIRQQRLES